MSLKTDRINTQILREVSLILQNEVRDRDLRMCTITAVETTNDLSISKAVSYTHLTLPTTSRV